VVEVGPGAGVEALLRAAFDADLLVVGVGAPYGPTPARLDLVRNRVVEEAPCTLMVVSAGEPPG
jgi:nucleotide-binding universal stress UspA family protein